MLCELRRTSDGERKGKDALDERRVKHVILMRWRRVRRCSERD